MSFISTPAPTIPWTSRTLGELLREVAGKYPDNAALAFGDRRLSYRQLDDLVEKVAASMNRAGVRHGDRVAALLGNRPEWVISYLAAARIGALFVPLNTWHKTSELRWAIAKCEPALVISETDFLGRDFTDDWKQLVPELLDPLTTTGSTEFPSLKRVVLLSDGNLDKGSWQTFVEEGQGSDLGEDSEDSQLGQTDAALEDDPALLLFTSGSTAEPKGVVLHHRGLVENGFNIGERRNLNSTDRVWLGSPLFYGFGSENCLMATLTHGATLYLQLKFSPSDAIDLVERERCTVYYGMSNMTRQIVEDPTFRPERVASLIKGAAGISPAERQILIERMGVSGANTSYGATEVYGNCLAGYPDDSLELKLTSSGAPLPGFEFRIVDPHSREILPQGQVGLLLVRGYTTPGYYRAPELTDAAFDRDGFYDTGDLGYFGPDGYFYYSSRLKEVMKIGGINVSPIELEQLLLQNPGVSSAAVLGVPDGDSGEAIVAVVSTLHDMDAEDVRAYVRERAAKFKVPRHVLIKNADWIPRTASGKVAKPQLLAAVTEDLAGLSWS